MNARGFTTLRGKSPRDLVQPHGYRPRGDSSLRTSQVTPQRHDQGQDCEQSRDGEWNSPRVCQAIDLRTAWIVRIVAYGDDVPKWPATPAGGPRPTPSPFGMSAHRWALIDKEIDRTLTPAERVELELLQEQAVAYRDRVAPLTIEGARELHQPLLARKRHNDQGRHLGHQISGSPLRSRSSSDVSVRSSSSSAARRSRSPACVSRAASSRRRSRRYAMSCGRLRCKRAMWKAPVSVSACRLPSSCSATCDLTMSRSGWRTRWEESGCQQSPLNSLRTCPIANQAPPPTRQPVHPEWPAVRPGLPPTRREDAGPTLLGGEPGPPGHGSRCRVLVAPPADAPWPG